MPRRVSLRLAALGAAALAAVVLLGSAARAQKSPEDEMKLPPPVAGRVEPAAVTLWVDISGKRNAAADRLNATHSDMAGRGYRFADAVPHVANGDLQGFFVTHVPAP
jgi:hypothetical protein